MTLTPRPGLRARRMTLTPRRNGRFPPKKPSAQVRDFRALELENLHSIPVRGPGRPGPFLGGTHDRILDFSFWGRTEKGHEMDLELVSGADFRATYNSGKCERQPPGATCDSQNCQLAGWGSLTIPTLVSWAGGLPLTIPRKARGTTPAPLTILGL